MQVVRRGRRPTRSPFDVLDRDQAHPRGAGAAAAGRQDGARPQSRQLLRRDRAGRVLSRRTSCRASTSANDPLLQGRLFSYLDTQLIAPRRRRTSTRFRSTAPKCPMHNLQRDGHMRAWRSPRGASPTSRTASTRPVRARIRRAASRSFAALEENGAKERIRAEQLRRPLQPGAPVLALDDRAGAAPHRQRASRSSSARSRRSRSGAACWAISRSSTRISATRVAAALGMEGQAEAIAPALEVEHRGRALPGAEPDREGAEVDRRTQGRRARQRRHRRQAAREPARSA